jgi:hypothetical protein
LNPKSLSRNTVWRYSAYKNTHRDKAAIGAMTKRRTFRRVVFVEPYIAPWPPLRALGLARSKEGELSWRIATR